MRSTEDSQAWGEAGRMNLLATEDSALKYKAIKQMTRFLKIVKLRKRNGRVTSVVIPPQRIYEPAVFSKDVAKQHDVTLLTARVVFRFLIGQ